MKYFFIFVCLILGCSPMATEKDVIKTLSLCDVHKGVAQFKMLGPREIKVMCADGSEFISDFSKTK